MMHVLQFCSFQLKFRHLFKLLRLPLWQPIQELPLAAGRRQDSLQQLPWQELPSSLSARGHDKFPPTPWANIATIRLGRSRRRRDSLPDSTGLGRGDHPFGSLCRFLAKAWTSLAWRTVQSGCYERSGQMEGSHLKHLQRVPEQSNGREVQGCGKSCCR